MIKTESSPLGMETYFLFQGKRVCSTVPKGTKWEFKIQGRWTGTECNTETEANFLVFELFATLRNDAIDKILFDKEIKDLEVNIIVVPSIRKEIHNN